MCSHQPLCRRRELTGEAVGLTIARRPSWDEAGHRPGLSPRLIFARRVADTRALRPTPSENRWPEVSGVSL
jgi:hypothetical protein